jgi:hypothetical protein
LVTLRQAGEFRAGARWVHVADDALDLVVPAAAQRLGIERQRAAEQLVQHDAQGVHVRAGVDVQHRPLRLLRRHVLRRADELARLRKQRPLRQALADGLGDTEVDDLHERLVVDERHEDVGRLEVAVDDGLLVGVLHRIAGLNEQLEPRAQRQLVTVGEVRDRLALHELHDEVGPARFGGAGVEDLGNVGMVHQRQSLALALEARDDLARIHAELHDFERNRAVNRCALLGPVDAAHPALTDERLDHVGPDLRRMRQLADSTGNVVQVRAGISGRSAGRVVGGRGHVQDKYLQFRQTPKALDK